MWVACISSKVYKSRSHVSELEVYYSRACTLNKYDMEVQGSRACALHIMQVRGRTGYMYRVRVYIKYVFRVHV